MLVCRRRSRLPRPASREPLLWQMAREALQDRKHTKGCADYDLGNLISGWHSSRESVKT
jgi:hypothetical protein